ncbi:uncharacterized protein PHALS_11309 [Plasmopara halstedii]|uniref:Uncharacterized protein n=1 Tax=Plasmopara halstedii TaxID=4781 RepID=A0A0P1AIT9_PLAHL|nr:uncharacterized protein PHALS_11309 [Plasmopara halstedii]CEG41145.1 hypothetical protein PHALS_11309 [Plasmopara halstedii]|eukprot:XP_024577514.1 hypothetical protein PHALS_11309 [Plasmopara halstedii]
MCTRIDNHVQHHWGRGFRMSLVLAPPIQVYCDRSKLMTIRQKESINVAMPMDCH